MTKRWCEGPIIKEHPSHNLSTQIISVDISVCVFVWMRLANLLKTAVSVLASTVRLTVSFIEPLMTVSVMLRCSQAVSSSALDRPQSLGEVGEGQATLVPNQPSHSRGAKKRAMGQNDRHTIV